MCVIHKIGISALDNILQEKICEKLLKVNYKLELIKKICTFSCSFFINRIGNENNIDKQYRSFLKVISAHRKDYGEHLIDFCQPSHSM